MMRSTKCIPQLICPYTHGNLLLMSCEIHIIYLNINAQDQAKICIPYAFSHIEYTRSVKHVQKAKYCICGDLKSK